MFKLAVGISKPGFPAEAGAGGQSRVSVSLILHRAICFSLIEHPSSVAARFMQLGYDSQDVQHVLHGSGMTFTTLTNRGELGFAYHRAGLCFSKFGNLSACDLSLASSMNKRHDSTVYAGTSSQLSKWRFILYTPRIWRLSHQHNGPFFPRYMIYVIRRNL